MPSPFKTPRSLLGFQQHGVIFRAEVASNNVVGDCPFCGKEEHFYANVQTKLWDCKHCQKKGNLLTFIAEVHQRNRLEFKGNAATQLATERGIRISTLNKWGVGWDGTQYTIPVKWQGQIVDLRRYRLRDRAMSTAGCKTWPIGGDALFDRKRQNKPVWVCEGEWDAMVWSEVLTKLKKAGVVVGLPGAGIFKEEWTTAFHGRKVSCILDHDDPGRLGDVRIAKVLKGIVRKLSFAHWTDSLPAGFDVRDLYLQSGKDTNKTYQAILEILKPESRQHVETLLQKTGGDDPEELEGEGLPANQVLAHYRKWLHLPRSDVLDVIFGMLLANRIEGDPLWLFLVAPSGLTKSELLMTLDTAPRIIPMTSLTPRALISGGTRPGGGDPSLIPLLDGNVLVIKDFTTIIDMNPIARDEIFGTLRDAYDRKTAKTFGHGVTRRYDSKFGVLAGVTPAVEKLTALHGSLGERFLKFRVRHGISSQSEKDLIERAIDNIAHEDGMREQLCEVAATALTREVVVSDIPKPSKSDKEYIIRLAQWVARLRGVVERERYSEHIAFRPSPEVGTRLAKQLTKLAMGVSIFRGERELSPYSLRLAATVARDTVPSRVEIVVRQLYAHLKRGETATAPQVSDWTRLPSITIHRVLEDLAMLGVVQRKKRTASSGMWSLAPSVYENMRVLGLYAVERAWSKKGEER